MITLSHIKKHPQIQEFIRQTDVVLTDLSYTDHGIRHSNLVARRAKQIAEDLKLSQREGELAAIGGFCHDMGNFLSRPRHNYYGALLFHQVFSGKMDDRELVTVIQAIANHDEHKEMLSFSSPVGAIVVLADKSDVHRSRVTATTLREIKSDIHDRVNYATKSSKIEVDRKKKRIILTLRIDTSFVQIMEYFEIFTERMVMCRKAAAFLGHSFGLIINKFKLM